MRIEVLFPESGAAHIAHARRAVGRALEVSDVIDGIVFSVVGLTRSEIHFMSKPSGRGTHVVFRCPACERPCAVLFPTAATALVCARCAKQRTRRQRESSTFDWKGRDVELEDRLLRELGKKNGGQVVDRLRRMAAEINAGDEDRLAAALSIAHDALLGPGSLEP